MKNKFAATAFASLALASSSFAAAYTETGDAGDLPATAQLVTGPTGTTLDSISGVLSLNNGISDGDMYEIYISNPAAFSASDTAFVSGKNNFDSQIFVFAASGLGVVGNDDAASGGSQSAIPASNFSGPAGLYYLLIDGSGRYPVSPAGLIFPNYTDGTTDPTSIVKPTGAGGASPISAYTGNSNEAGSYVIAFTGAQFFTPVPEPGTYALVLIAAAGLGLGLRARRRRHVPILAAGVLVLAGTVPAHAQKATGTPIKLSTATVPDNLNCGLQQMVQDYLTASASTSKVNAATASTVTSVLANYPGARADAQNRVIVDIYLDGTDTIDAVAARLEGLGCKIEARLDWYGHGALAVWLPLDQAVATGTMKGVHYVNLAIKPSHNVGKCTSQGTVVLKIEPIASMTGGLGQGITVGALSDSYDKLKTTGTGTTAAPLYPNDHAVDDVTSGDLPGVNNPDGYTTPVNVIKDYTSSTGVEDEGRGMLQIVHDMVPAASLAFYTADISEVDFAAGIVALQQSGCNVICDDVGYFDEPMFSDGPVAQAIDKVTAAGAVYFSSAGNDGSSGYVGTFNPVTNNAASQGYLAAQGVTYSGLSTAEQAAITDFQAFGTNADGTPILVQNIRIPGTSADAAGHLEFQWDDPYLTIASQGATNNVTTDFDILVFSTAGAIQTSRSGMTNNYTSKVPLELPGTTLAAATSYKIVIARTNRAAASATPNLATHLRYAVQTNDTPVRGDFITAASAETHGHATAATCIGTAAYRYDSSPVADVHDPTHTIYPIVEQFSSNGPVSIYFDSAGNRLASPVVRKQPLLSATNGVDTSFFPPVGVTSGTTPPPVPSPTNPSSQDFDGDGYPNFFGTSAAAPSGAGVAAALLGIAKANNITLSPADVRSLLTSTAQGNEDQTPGYAVGTAGAVTVNAAGYGRTDNNDYTVAYSGAAGTTLSSITIDLSPIGAHFDTTTAIPTDTSTTATGTGVVVSAFNGTTTPAGTTAPSVASYTVGTGSGGTANSLLTVNFSNFSPGATLKFGIGRRNDGVNIFAQLSEVLGGMTPTSPGALLGETDSAAGTASGRFVNTFSQKWNYKEGYGLINAQAAVNKMLGQ